MSVATEPSSIAPSGDDSEGTVDENTLHQGYRTIFQNFLTQTLRHRTGHFSASMGASIFPPSAHWTAEEKDLFFRAVARHSPLRPDLIAAEIHTKTLVDVCGYIALLRDGAQKSETGISLLDLPAALEMSDSWIEFEEKQALVLVDAVASWEADQKEKDREEVLQSIKDRKKLIKSALVDRTWDVRAEETMWLHLYEERRAELEEVWEREDALEVLDGVDLQMLDAVVRKGMEIQEREAGSDIAAASPTLQVNADDGLDLASLSPAERRRVKARLFMRRKRAQDAGRYLNESITRLKPGRKPQAGPKHSAPSSRVPSEGHEPRELGIEGKGSGPEGEPLGEETRKFEDTGSKRKVGQRGMTRAEKAAAKFAKYGLDFKHLQEHELDLFHLRRFGSLMSAHSHGNVENIKYSVIRLLRAYLDNWLAIVVQHAILAAEQERRAKEHTEVWKTTLDEVKVRHVKHALAVLDCTNTKRAVLERLEQCIREGESKGDEGMDDDYLPEAWSRLAREVYPPLINHPCLLDPQFELNKRPIDDVMSPPTCSDAFMDAEQGERLESMDAHNAKRHERMLWRLVGKEDEIESDGAPDEEDMSDYTQEPTLALRKWGATRRAGGAIKSEPFVHTSDEESGSE